MKRYKLLVYVLFFFPFAFSLKAQVKPVLPVKKVPVNTINYEQGLLNNETAGVVTDTLGFTWISTASGLQRYNGYTAESVDPIIGRDTIKIRSRVYFLRLKSGDLWVSCKKGVLNYNPFTNGFSNVIPLNSRADEVFSIIPLIQTADGVWCIKKGEGIVVYDLAGKLTKHVPSIAKNSLDNVLHSEILESATLIANNHDHIFIRSSTNSILIFNTANYQFSELFQPGADISAVGCNDHFLYLGNGEEVNKYQISNNKLAGTLLLKSIADKVVRGCSVHPIGNNRVIVSTDDRLVELDADLHNPKLVTTFDGKSILVASVNVQHIYDDAFQRVWLLTNDDIKRIQDKEIPFAYLKYPDAPNNFVRCLYFDEQTHKLLAGCINGGLQLYDNASNPLWPDLLQTNEVKDILAINKLSTNNYLVITWNNGWFLLDLAKKKLSVFDFSAGEKYKKLVFINSFSNNIQRVNDSTILVASAANAFRCVFRGNQLISVTPLMPFTKTINDKINTAYISSDSSLWIGRSGGVVYRKDKKGKITLIDLPEKFGTRCFAEDSKHHLWIGTSSGLYVCNLDGTLLKSFYKKSGLLNDCIYSMLPMRSASTSSVIVGSNMGLSTVSLSGNIANYTKELGLQDNEFNTAAALTTRDGKFYFGGVSGITAFYPSALSDRQTRPILNMTKLIVNDSAYNYSGTLKRDTISLSYNQNHLQFDFAAMGPLNADKYFYRYRLLGFEKYWQNTHRPTGIRYILQPATYTLQITCSNELSGTEVKRTFVIIITPPFWLTWWFFTLVGLCGIATVVLIVTFYNKRRYQKALQELIVNQRLQDQRERISRDLHDNLGAQANAIFYGTELLKQTNTDEQKLVGNLHDTAGDMLTVLRETLWALKINEIEAANLWLRVLNFARKIGNYYPGVKINITGNPADGISIKASMALNMVLIIQEAINNAVRHSDASVISVSSYATDASWLIEIADDGKGFDITGIAHKTESYGLENMAERAKESNIPFTINSVPGHGTKVSLEILLSKNQITI